ncbi:hypothetical protein DV735_g2822, partial [Chaetothyriales sp. CBS 134920]
MRYLDVKITIRYYITKPLTIASFVYTPYWVPFMSFVVLARPCARSACPNLTAAALSGASISIIITRQPQLATRRQLSTTRPLGVIKPEDHSQWRRDSVARLNRRAQDPLVIPHDPKPSSRGGLITPECYAPRPEYLPILLDPLPTPVEDEGGDGAKRTLDSTRPPHLDMPTKQEGQSLVSYYYAVGKAYLAFYKTGLRNVRSNWREYRELRAWIHPFTIVAAARYGGQQWKTKKPVIDPATGVQTTSNHMPVPHISRREFQLYYRTISDVLKLIPFTFVLLICGEFTPLAILLFGNSIVPLPCRIPAQQRQAMDASVDRFRQWKRHMHKLTSLNSSSSSSSSSNGSKLSSSAPKHAFDFNTPRLEHPWRRDMLFAYLVGQSRFARPLLPVMGSFYFHTVLHQRLTRYWERIFCDTILIRREGGFAALSPTDVFEYALNYGSLSLLVIMEHEIRARKNYDFVNDALKQRLVPILEREADAMFHDDFTRLMPHLHWMRAYRNTALWRDTPDVLAAVDLLNTDYPPPVEPYWGPTPPAATTPKQDGRQEENKGKDVQK